MAFMQNALWLAGMQVRHAEAEAARVRACLADAEQDAMRERQRADEISRALLDLQVGAPAQATRAGTRGGIVKDRRFWAAGATERAPRLQKIKHVCATIHVQQVSPILKFETLRLFCSSFPCSNPVAIHAAASPIPSLKP